MSARSTYLVVDNSRHVIQDDIYMLSDISRFVYQYLINPIVFNKSNKVSLIKCPQTLMDVDNKPLDWKTITNFMADIDKFDSENAVDLISTITDVLQSASFTAKKLKSCDLLVLSSFDSKYDWERFEAKIKYALEAYPNINLIIIDTIRSDSDNIYHDNNIDKIKSIIEFNTTAINRDTQNFYYTIEDAFLALDKSEFIVPKFKKPTEIYSYTLQILEIPDLEFNISAYPFTKRTGLSDYVTSTTIDSTTREKVKNKYQFYYDELNEDGEIEEREIQNPSFITEAYNFGTSSLLITDLPNNIFNLNSIKSMIITSFVPESSIAPWYIKQDSLIILPSSKNFKNNHGVMDKDYAMYSELWKSMLRLRVVATVRFVKRNGADVKYGLIYPQGFVDKETEVSGSIDFGCFIFVETIFKDDEKLVNLPDLLKMKVDDKIETDMDKLVDSFRLDKTVDEEFEEEEEDDDIKEVDACVVSMNEIPTNDIFYRLRQQLKQEISDEEIHPTELGKRISNTLQKYNNPLMLIERLVYVITYVVLKNHLSQGGDANMSLYEMFQEQGFPERLVERWVKNAQEGKMFSLFELNSLCK